MTAPGNPADRHKATGAGWAVEGTGKSDKEVSSPFCVISDFNRLLYHFLSLLYLGTEVSGELAFWSSFELGIWEFQHRGISRQL